MLRQRNIKQETPNNQNNGFNGGVSIGGFDDHMAVTNNKFKTSNDSCNCWKYFALMLFLVAGSSIGGNVYLTMLLKNSEQKLNIINNDLEGERAHKEGCLSELEGIESHMKTKEQEKFQLEKELSRLKRAVLKGGATEHPQQGRQQHDGGHHPPKPEHPTPHPQHQNVHDQVPHEESQQQQQQQEELQRQQEEEQQRQHQEELQRQHQEELQRQHQEELQRQQQEEYQQQQQQQYENQMEEQKRQHEEQLRKQQEEEQLRRQHEEQLRRQQEEEQLRRQQEEMKRQEEIQAHNQNEHQEQ